jgi:hypothetical protein
MRVNGYRYARPFEEDEEVSADEAATGEEAAGEEPDYHFEGFSVEFLDKVALLPVEPARPVTARGR